MARIRTVKPEMWTDGKVVRLSDAANLFFIALLNQADDDGRLQNDSKQIECRAPRFWGRAETLLKELADAGLVVTFGLQGQFLQIKNFSKHQVIDRKRPSEIPSPNARRTLADHSTQGKEGKGRERKGTPIAGSSPAGGEDASKPYQQKEDPLSCVVYAWKLLEGQALEDRDWDKRCWGRTAKTAKALLEIFNGDWESCARYMQTFAKDYRFRKLSFTLETMLKNYDSFMADRRQNAKV